MIALVIFSLTFVGIAMTKVPLVRLDRPAVAFVGAVAMVLFGVVTLPEAVGLVSWDTIALLLGMMVIIGALQMDGYTQALAAAVFRPARTGMQLLVSIVLFSAVASAFLVNDAVVLVLTPLVIAVCRARALNPVPFLMATAMASNVGSTATITGNPQNVLIGLHSGISFGTFLAALLPVAVAAGAILIVMLRWRYKGEMGPARLPKEKVEAATPPAERLKLRPSMIIVAGVVAAFIASPWLGVELSLIALVGAALALATSRSWPSEIFAQVNWVLLLFFASLFVVIFGAVQAGLFDPVIQRIHPADGLMGISTIHAAGMVFSQVVSNVPFTMLMLPVLGDRATDPLWLSLAAGATLAGNLTLVGSIANLIVAETASQQGVKLEFWEFARVGLPVTVVTTLVSVCVIWAEYALGLL